MGVFKDFSVCLKNKNININKTDKWKEGDPDIHVKSNEPCFSFCSYFEAFNSETNSHFSTSGKHPQPNKGLKKQQSLLMSSWC